MQIRPASLCSSLLTIVFTAKGWVNQSWTDPFKCWPDLELFARTIAFFLHLLSDIDGIRGDLPDDACVEVPCPVDADGVTPCHMGALPTQIAALNMTNINVQLLTVEAAVTRRKDTMYQAAVLDPHTAAELSIDDIVSLCDELIKAHGSWLPTLR